MRGCTALAQVFRQDRSAVACIHFFKTVVFWTECLAPYLRHYKESRVDMRCPETAAKKCVRL